jgi:hypothetical protein
MLRLVAAGGPATTDGEIHFHPRLTVLADTRPALADWLTALLGIHAAPDTLLEIDHLPARTYDLPRGLRALPPAEPLRPEMLRALALGREATATNASGVRGTREISAELAAEMDARSVDLANLDAERADRLLARALADLDNTAYVRPLVVDRVLDAFSPEARRCGYERLVAHSRRRQIVLVTSNDDIARWAAHGESAEVALAMNFANLTPAD